MKSLVVASQKGGVGKTTTALNLAYAFVDAGFRVVLIDTDPQGAIGLSLSSKMASRPGLADLMAREADLDRALLKTKIPDFAILPIGQLAPAESQSFATAMTDGTHLSTVLSQLEGDYDLAVVDTPCGFGGITEGAMRAATHIVSPVQAEPIALRSIPQLLEMVRSLANDGVKARVIGFIITMLQSDDEQSMAVAREIADMFPPRLLFSAPIPRDRVFLEATAAGVPVAMLRRPAPPVTHVFQLIAADLAGRMELTLEKEIDEPRFLLD